MTTGRLMAALRRDPEQRETRRRARRNRAVRRAGRGLIDMGAPKPVGTDSPLACLAENPDYPGEYACEFPAGHGPVTDDEEGVMLWDHGAPSKGAWWATVSVPDPSPWTPERRFTAAEVEAALRPVVLRFGREYNADGPGAMAQDICAHTLAALRAGREGEQR